MSQIGAFEAKNTLGALLDQEVEKGEEIVITRHGRPVARLAPLDERSDKSGAAAAQHRIRARARGLEASIVSWDTLKIDRDIGRR